MEQKDDYIIQQLTLNDSNLPAVLEVVKDAFIRNSPNEGGTIAFKEDTFRLMFNSPHLPKNLNVVAIYKPTNEIVGFTGGIPRDLAYNGRIYKFGIPGFASVHWKHQRKGLALRMGKKLLKISKDLGYQGGFALFEPEAYGIDTSEKLISETNLKRVEILNIKKFLIRIFNVKEVSSVVKLKWFEKLGLRLLQRIPKIDYKNVRKYEKKDGDRLYELMQDHLKNNDMAFLRDYDDFIWYLNHPAINCVVNDGDNGQINGFIVAWEMQLAGFGNNIPCGWLDLVHTYRLSLNESTNLCNYLCKTCRERGWFGIQSPYIPYFNPKPFKKARFVFFPKQLLVHMYCLEDLDIPDSVDSIYLDWR
ncbi:MAG: GNAT family N-acetyltransferase [Candidatus Lokiarchaeota archaeon]|nr:GNAT family N-acetyltransferase [Candidatus Lokiarchaeota archaeon]